MHKRPSAASGWSLLATLVLGILLIGEPAHAQGPDPTKWRSLDPENALYIDTAHGRIVVEMYPEVAPTHVARIRELSRRGFYDNLVFHRVIDGFMAQGGDPLGTGEGGSDLPDLTEEFLFRRGPEMPFIEAAVQAGARVGFYKALPITTQPDRQMLITADGRAGAWGLHCQGIASMARANDPNSANSQFFLMRDAYPSLDKRYTIWGRVIWGMPAVLALRVTAEGVQPDRMLRVRVAADLPADERAPIYILRSDSRDFRELIDRTRNEREADFSVCDVEIPVRVPDQEGAQREGERGWWLGLIPRFGQR
jgi:peptidylprolyl isomerase